MHKVIEIKRSLKNVPGMETYFLDTLYVIENLGENKIAELGPKEIFNFRILLTVYIKC